MVGALQETTEVAAGGGEGAAVGERLEQLASGLIHLAYTCDSRSRGTVATCLRKLIEPQPVRRSHTLLTAVHCVRL